MKFVDFLFANPYRQESRVGMGVNDEQYQSQAL